MKSVSSLFSMHRDHCVLLSFRSRLLKLNRLFGYIQGKHKDSGLNCWGGLLDVCDDDSFIC